MKSLHKLATYVLFLAVLVGAVATLAFAADKADFAASRIQRWFDHPPDHGQGSISKPQRKLGVATGVR